MPILNGCLNSESGWDVKLGSLSSKIITNGQLAASRILANLVEGFHPAFSRHCESSRRFVDSSSWTLNTALNQPETLGTFSASSNHEYSPRYRARGGWNSAPTKPSWARTRCVHYKWLLVPRPCPPLPGDGGTWRAQVPCLLSTLYYLHYLQFTGYVFITSWELDTMSVRSSQPSVARHWELTVPDTSTSRRTAGIILDW